MPWKSEKAIMNHKALDDFGNETVIMGFMASQKPSRIDLMQNCDLPPPSKVFIGSDKAVISSLNKICRRKIFGDGKDFDIDIRGESGRFKDDRRDALIRALRSSQTRARETEKKVACLTKERDCLSELLLAEARNSFAYRLQLRLLDFQVFKLQSELQQRQKTSNCNCGQSLKEDDDSYEEREEKTNLTWMAAVALCWGFAGVGISLGSRYLF